MNIFLLTHCWFSKYSFIDIQIAESLIVCDWMSQNNCVAPFHMCIFTNPLISFRQIGHLRRECPHGIQVARWPHGKHAKHFSSSKHNTQRLLVDIISSSTFFLSTLCCCSLVDEKSDGDVGDSVDWFGSFFTDGIDPNVLDTRCWVSRKSFA